MINTVVYSAYVGEKNRVSRARARARAIRNKLRSMHEICKDRAVVDLAM